ncbi:hypothetical protein SAMN04487786_1288 [Paenisporosarcina quisquiliarum]|nr:hypothetical protein SAMN04487786_1288 [Paenisporosarcina quisquiliarum]
MTPKKSKGSDFLIKADTMEELKRKCKIDLEDFKQLLN